MYTIQLYAQGYYDAGVFEELLNRKGVEVDTKSRRGVSGCMRSRCGISYRGLPLMIRSDPSANTKETYFIIIIVSTLL